MSANLTELLRRAGAPQAPNALAELKRSLEREGALGSEELAQIAARTGLPESTIYGITTFYEDLRTPQGARHIRVCTGTACFAAGAQEQLPALSDALGVTPGSCSLDGERSLAEVACLGFCHSSPAISDRGVIDAGSGVLERTLTDSARPADEPEWQTTLARPVLTAPGDWSGLERALKRFSPQELLAEVAAAQLRGRGGAGFPAARKWQAARATGAPQRYILANGDEGDPGSYIDKYLMERNPALVLEGMALAGYATGANQGFILTRSEYPNAMPRLEAAIAQAQRAGWLGENIRGSGFHFQIAGCEPQALEEAAHIYGEAERASILWGLGVTEHRYGSEVVALICNLALMTGRIGSPGCALLPLRGQNNVQGSSDMGALPDTYTAYRSVADEDVARSFEAAWNVPLSRRPGYRIPEMLDAACSGSLKAMYIIGEDIAQTDPNSAHVREALSALELLVCQEIFENETTAYADVILPASSFLEKEGTFTNAERRIQHVAPALQPPGQARRDLEIITAVSSALGHKMGYASPAAVMAEIAALTPHFAGVSYERLGEAGLCWPVEADGSDSPILYERRFETSSGRGRFAALPYKPPGEQVDAELPLTLITGRILEHYNAGTMTRRTPNIALRSDDHLEINPIDAQRLWIEDGATVSVRSRYGRCELRAALSERIEPGHVFATFHFPETQTNLLVGPSADVNTACPEYKVVAVDVRPLSERPSRQPALAQSL